MKARIEKFQERYFGGWKFIFFPIIVAAINVSFGYLNDIFIEGTRWEVWRDNFHLIFYWLLFSSSFWFLLHLLTGEKADHAKFWKTGAYIFSGLLLIPVAAYFRNGTPLVAFIVPVNQLFLTIAYVYILWWTYNEFIGSKRGNINYFDVGLLTLCGVLLLPVYALFLWALAGISFPLKT